MECRSLRPRAKCSDITIQLCLGRSKTVADILTLRALAVVSLVNNIASFVDITVRVVDRLKEIDENSSNYARSLSDVTAQLPLLVAITRDISIDGERRRQLEGSRPPRNGRIIRRVPAPRTLLM